MPFSLVDVLPVTTERTKRPTLPGNLQQNRERSRKLKSLKKTFHRGCTYLCIGRCPHRQLSLKFVRFFETGSLYVVPAVLEPSVDKAGPELRSTCLCFHRPDSKGMLHHTLFAPEFSVSYQCLRQNHYGLKAYLPHYPSFVKYKIPNSGGLERWLSG